VWWFRSGNSADWENIRWSVEDLGGLNGTFVNRQKIEQVRKLFLSLVFRNWIRMLSNSFSSWIRSETANRSFLEGQNFRPYRHCWKTSGRQRSYPTSGMECFRAYPNSVSACLIRGQFHLSDTFLINLGCSVAHPECSIRIRIFPSQIPNLGSRGPKRHKISGPDSQHWIDKEFKYFNPNIVPKFSEGWSRMFISDRGFSFPPGSRI
jgi:hypothetical protein